jgi:hypothetical protein
MADGYTFPFDTCEGSNSGAAIAQPWSFAVNLVSAITLAALACMARTSHVRVLLLVFALFEAYHAYSHARHTSYGRVVVHVIGYVMSLTMWWVVHRLLQLNSVPTRVFAVVAVAITLDVAAYLMTWGHGLWTIFTGLLVLAAVVAGHWNLMPTWVRVRFGWLLVGMGVLGLMFYNEQRNCRAMLAQRRFPYHAIIEVWGMLLFVILAFTFLHWERV